MRRNLLGSAMTYANSSRPFAFLALMVTYCVVQLPPPQSLTAFKQLGC